LIFAQSGVMQQIELEVNQSFFARRRVDGMKHHQQQQQLADTKLSH